MNLNNSLLDMLSILKNKALRQGVWYKRLNIHERELVSLSLKYIRSIKNPRLAIVLGRIVIKLKLIVDTNIKIEQQAFNKAVLWIKSALSIGWHILIRSARDMVEWFVLLDKYNKMLDVDIS